MTKQKELISDNKATRTQSLISRARQLLEEAGTNLAEMKEPELKRDVADIQHKIKNLESKLNDCSTNLFD